MIYLDTKIDEIKTSKKSASLIDIQKALNKLFTSKHIAHSKVELTNESELALEIYYNTVVLQDYGNSTYDGPGGPGEKLCIRVNVKHLFYNAEKIMNLLDNYQEEKLIKFLNTLPKAK